MPFKITFNNLLHGFALAVFALAVSALQVGAQCNTPYFKNSTRKIIPNINVGVEKIDYFSNFGRLLISSYDRANGNFVVLFDDGAGNFGDPMTTFVGIDATSFFVGDLNGDGIKDLLVRRNTNPVSVTTFTGNYNGTFTQWNTTTFSQFDVNIYEKAVKFDNDPRPEIFAGGVYYPINSDGTVAPGNPIFEVSAGLLGDFNGDGKTDYVKNFIATNQPYTNLYLNNGNATFSPTTIATPAILPLKAADLNNDGKDDLIAAETNGSVLAIFLSSSSGALTRVNTNPAGFSPSFLSVGDFNGDGFKDILSGFSNGYTVYFGSATGAFTQTTVNRNFFNGYPNADFDGDGRDDFIATAPDYYFSTTSFVIKRNVCAPPGQTGIVDFDGDGRTDLALWRPSDGRWSLKSSQTNDVTQVFWGSGSLGDVPTPGDYDGDGKTDVAIWRNSNGVWYVRRTSDSSAQYLQWGTTGDKPVQGDYDGDGIMDVAVYRPSNGVWYIRYGSTGGLYAVQFGVATDKPVPADFDGDGRTDIAVYRPSTGVWYVLKSTGGFSAAQFGIAEDKPVPGDYDSDGEADLAVFRPSTNTWYLHSSLTNDYRGFQWGTNGDLAAPINLNGIYSQATVYRPSQGRWYATFGSSGYDYFDFGGVDEVPVSSLPRIE